MWGVWSLHERSSSDKIKKLIIIKKNQLVPFRIPQFGALCGSVILHAYLSIQT